MKMRNHCGAGTVTQTDAARYRGIIMTRDELRAMDVQRLLRVVQGSDGFESCKQSASFYKCHCGRIRERDCPCPNSDCTARY